MQNRIAFFFWIVAFALVVTSVVLVPVLVSNANANRGGGNVPLNLTLRDPTWACPEPVLVYEPAPREFGGTCISWYNATTLYYWRFFSSTPEMRRLTFNDNRTEVLSDSSNLFQTPYNGGSFTDCAYNFQDDTFVLIGDSEILTTVTPDGNILSEVSVTSPFPTTDGYGTTLFFDPMGNAYMSLEGNVRYDVFYPVNLTTGLVGNSIVPATEIDYDIFRFTGGDLNQQDGKVYIIASAEGNFDPPSTIVRLDLENSRLESLCTRVPVSGARIGSISFDVDNVAWISLGGQVNDPSFIEGAIYRFNDTFTPSDPVSPPQTFTLECSESIETNIQDTQSYPPREATVVGLGCFGGPVRVIEQSQSTFNASFPTAQIESASKRKRNVVVVEKSKLYEAGKKRVFQRQTASNHVSYSDYYINHTLSMEEEVQNRKRSLSYDQETLGTFSLNTVFGTGQGSDPNDPSVPKDALRSLEGVERYTSYQLFGRVSDTQLLLSYVFNAGEGELFNLGVELDMITGDCANYDNQRILRADHEADKAVIGWTTNSRSKLCLAVFQSDVTSFELYEFDFTGQSMYKLELGVWGDYYNVCWNDLNDATPWSKCYVMERERILNPMLGMPRILPIDAPSIVATGGHSASSMPFHQEYDFGTRASLIAAFPCGVISSITANDGGVINLKLCTAVDFDMSSVTATDSTTVIGSYNDGASGTCASETACIVTTAATLDPNRFDIISTFRNFPELNAQRMAFAITTDADGNGDSKILTGTFRVENTGALVSEGTLQTIDPNTRDQYNPSVAFTQDGVFWLMFREIAANGADSDMFLTRLFYNQTDFRSILSSSQFDTGQVYTVHSGQNRIINKQILVVPGYNHTIESFYPYTRRVSTVNNVIFNGYPRAWNAPQRFITKYFAVDDCHQYAECVSSVTFR